MPHNRARDRLSAINGRRYAKIRQTADYIGVSERTVHQMIEDGRLTAYRLGARVVRIDLNEVDRAMAPGGVA